VEVDLVRKMVNAVDWTNQQEHIRMLDVAAGLAHNLASEGYRPVLVVDTFSGNKIERFLEILRGLQPARTVRIFALHAAEDVLRQRLVERPADGFKDFDISRRLNSDVLSARDPRERLVDSSRLEPAEIARMIYEDLVGSGCAPAKALATNDATMRKTAQLCSDDGDKLACRVLK
jgi:hypothetical protein